MLALRARVGHGGDPAAREPLGDEERERSPAAAEVEDAHAVFEARALAGEREHRLFGGGQVVHAVRPQAAAVLEARPQELLEEGRGQLVVLPVGRILMDRERPGGEGGGVAAQRRRIVRRALVLLELFELVSQPPPDDRPQQRVGNVSCAQHGVIARQGSSSRLRAIVPGVGRAGPPGSPDAVFTSACAAARRREPRDPAPRLAASRPPRPASSPRRPSGARRSS